MCDHWHQKRYSLERSVKLRDGKRFNVDPKMTQIEGKRSRQLAFIELNTLGFRSPSPKGLTPMSTLHDNLIRITIGLTKIAYLFGHYYECSYDLYRLCVVAYVVLITVCN